MHLEWENRYSVGQTKMDDQHKQIIRYINQMKDIKDRHDQNITVDPAAVETVLMSLKHYTDYHFKDEEAMMEACYYDGLDDHRAIHVSLRTRLEGLIRRFKSDGQDVIPMVSEFLNNWLVKHILEVDMGYFNFLHPEPIIWTPSYSVGNDYLDSQHKAIIELINKTTEGIEVRDHEIRFDLDKQGSVLEDLVEVTKTHFKDEEILMSKCRFPGTQAHAKEHSKIIDDLAIQVSFLKRGYTDIMPRLIGLFRKWVQHHILVEDKQYKGHIASDERPD